MNTEARQRVHAIIEKIKALTASYRAEGIELEPYDPNATQVDDLMIEAVRLTGWSELADAYKEFFEL